MTASIPLSDELTALADLVSASLHGREPLPIARLYARLIRARDEAVCLEARAGTRDRVVRALLQDVASQCDELARLAAAPGLASKAEAFERQSAAQHQGTIA